MNWQSVREFFENSKYIKIGDQIMDISNGSHYIVISHCGELVLLNIQTNVVDFDVGTYKTTLDEYNNRWQTHEFRYTKRSNEVSLPVGSIIYNPKTGTRRLIYAEGCIHRLLGLDSFEDMDAFGDFGGLASKENINRYYGTDYIDDLVFITPEQWMANVTM